MSNSQPSHLVSPDGIRVPVHGAVETVNLRSRGYRDLTPQESAQLDVERAGLALEHAKRDAGASSDAAKDAQQEYQLAVQRAEQFLAEAMEAATDAAAEVPAAPETAAETSAAPETAAEASAPDVAPARSSRGAKPATK